MSVEDIIKASFDQEPTAVAGAFNNAIKDKLMAALESRRDQIAQGIYGSAEEDVEPDEDLDNSDTEEYDDENT